eukprot:932055_1
MEDSNLEIVHMDDQFKRFNFSKTAINKMDVIYSDLYNLLTKHDKDFMANYPHFFEDIEELKIISTLIQYVIGYTVPALKKFTHQFF